jgi:hypothetical protein
MSRRAIRTLPPLLAALACVPIGIASAGDQGQLDSPYPPHRAGMRIAIAGHTCTSGFGVADTTTSSLYALTAGHCGGHGRVKISGERVGPVVGSSFICCRLTNSDSSLYGVPAEVTSATILKSVGKLPFGGGSATIGSPFGSPELSVIPVAGYLENSAIRKGLDVCAVGAFGGYSCGTVTDTRYRYRFSSGRRLTGLACFDDPVSDGDSGGPVFVLRRGEAIAVGIVSIGDGVETCFSTIENALRAWNVDLLVADGDGFEPAGGATSLPSGFRDRPNPATGPKSVPWDDALRDFGIEPPTMPRRPQ